MSPLWNEPDWPRTLASSGYGGCDTSEIYNQNRLTCSWMCKKGHQHKRYGVTATMLCYIWVIAERFNAVEKSYCFLFIYRSRPMEIVIASYSYRSALIENVIAFYSYRSENVIEAIMFNIVMFWSNVADLCLWARRWGGVKHITISDKEFGLCNKQWRCLSF